MFLRKKHRTEFLAIFLINESCQYWEMNKSVARELAAWVLHKLRQEMERAKRKLRSVLADLTALPLLNAFSILNKTTSAVGCSLFCVGFFFWWCLLLLFGAVQFACSYLNWLTVHSERKENICLLWLKNILYCSHFPGFAVTHQDWTSFFPRVLAVAWRSGFIWMRAQRRLSFKILWVQNIKNHNSIACNGPILHVFSSLFRWSTHKLCIRKWNAIKVVQGMLISWINVYGA